MTTYFKLCGLHLPLATATDDETVGTVWDVVSRMSFLSMFNLRSWACEVCLSDVA
jgi:hypothetical protein